jgi:hypothetical protein
MAQDYTKGGHKLMDTVNSLLALVVDLVNRIIPELNLPAKFIEGLDTATVVIIDLIEGAGYFIPLEVLVYCMMTMFVVDNFAIVARIGQWIAGLIRG